MTREPGNLLPVMVMRERVGGVLRCRTSSRCICRLGRGQNVAATALTGYFVAVEPYSVNFYCRSFFAPLAAGGAGMSWSSVKALFARVRGAAWYSGLPWLGIDGSGYSPDGRASGE